MTTRECSKYATSVLFIVSACLGGCGTSDDYFFDRDQKKYGVNDANVQGNEAGASVNEDRAESGVKVDGESIESFRQNPNEIIFRSRYQGIMDRQSLHLLYVPPLQGGVAEKVKPEESRIYSDIIAGGIVLRRGNGPAIERLARVPIDLIAEQTAGDKDSAIYRQKVDAPFAEYAGDFNAFDNHSENGYQIYDRRLSPGACPDSLVCIDRAQFIPDSGVAQTFCYQDAKGDMTSVPIGISPGASYEVVKDLPRHYGPYEVLRYAVADVDCENTELAPSMRTKIEVGLGLTRDEMVLEKVNAINLSDEKIDFGATVFVTQLTQDGTNKAHNTLPYIDTVTGFQSTTAYYFNNASGRLLSIVKTVRKQFVGAPTALGFEGIVVDIAFRFCKSLLTDKGVDYCEQEEND